MDRYRLHPAAEAEYLEAYHWYLDRSARAALGFEQEFKRLLELCSEKPLLFPLYDRVSHYAIMDVYPYSLVYDVREWGILVVAVAHSSRKPNYWRKRI